MYSLSTAVESHTWNSIEDLLNELHAEEGIVPCGVIHEGETPIEFTNTFELLKAIQERIKLKKQGIRFSLFNITFEINKVILTIEDYVLIYKG